MHEIEENKKFKNKYKTQSNRLQSYNYSGNGMYFVTICTAYREYFFGEVVGGKMVLNGVGEIVKEELLKTSVIRQNIILDSQIIMPNHLHAIIEIINQPYGTEANRIVEVGGPTTSVETPRRGVSTGAQKGTYSFAGGGFNPNWKPNSLGSVINQLKSVCTKKIRRKFNPITFAWQSRFYDRIIRDENELNRIREYIQNNPAEWERDRNNIENIKAFD